MMSVSWRTLGRTVRKTAECNSAQLLQGLILHESEMTTQCTMACHGLKITSWPKKYPGNKKIAAHYFDELWTHF